MMFDVCVYVLFYICVWNFLMTEFERPTLILCE